MGPFKRLVLGQYWELEAQTWLKLKLESSCIHCKHLEHLKVKIGDFLTAGLLGREGGSEDQPFATSYHAGPSMPGLPAPALNHQHDPDNFTDWETSRNIGP